MEEAAAHPGFRLAFQIKNIHTAAMILLLLIGMLGAEDSVMKADQVLVVKSPRTLTLFSLGRSCAVTKWRSGVRRLAPKSSREITRLRKVTISSTAETRRADSTSQFTFPIRMSRTNRK